MKVLDLLVPPTSLSWPSLTVIRLPGWVRPGRRPGVRHVLTGVWSHPAVWRQGLRHRVADVDRRQRLRSLSEVQRLESCLPRRRSVDTGGQMSNNLNRSRFSKYMQKSPTSPVLLEKLPPTERAAFYHSLCVHLQRMQ